MLDYVLLLFAIVLLLLQLVLFIYMLVYVKKAQRNYSCVLRKTFENDEKKKKYYRGENLK